MSATDLRKSILTSRQFTHDFGVDLDEIRKLGKEEMESLFEWLRDAGMVECFDVLQNQVPANINSPEPLGVYFLPYHPPSIVLPSDLGFGTPDRRLQLKPHLLRERW
ncbi:hypothetical protein N7492_000853 [Penicillium capsulatum]|uniref:Uncharacterized protein n=1 Tax=Penicillium capsulatum TaxID=69766 RepID=A0A9W9ISP5_9EURO|nr:hypothetical protein N7492_000853 [Penicillium capsulatum]KAJ6130089.1 hypothetical protein N7512_002869 [Penicillium capsulatum]